MAIDHVHAHFGTNSTVVALLARIMGGPPFSFTAHGPEEFDNPLAQGIDEKIRHAAFVVAISEYGKSQFSRWAALCGVAQAAGRPTAVLDDMFLKSRLGAIARRPGDCLRGAARGTERPVDLDHGSRSRFTPRAWSSSCSSWAMGRSGVRSNV